MASPPLLTQSTATTVQLGPFIDPASDVTEETGLTPGIEVSKAGAAFAARNSGDAVAHDAEGWYRIPLDATDTNTLGSLILKAHDSANHKPVAREFYVVPAQEEAASREVFLGILKQSTARQIVVGPFLSVSTRAALTSLTVGDITCGVIKDGSPPTNTAVTLTASGGNNDMAHLANGLWTVELTATDTGTLGPGAITFTDSDVFFGPLVYRWIIVPDHVYDGLVADTDVLEVNLIQVLGTACTESTSTAGVLDVNVAEISDSAAAANSLETAIDTGDNLVAANVTQISDDATAASNLEALFDGTGYDGGVGATRLQVDVEQVNNSSAAADNLQRLTASMIAGTVDNTAFTATTTILESDDITEATDDHYNGQTIVFITGALQYQRTTITDYTLNGGRGRFTYDTITDAPADNDTFLVI